jgi:hypothetical protein
VRRKFLGFSFTLREVKRRIAARAIVRFKQKGQELRGKRDVLAVWTIGGVS